MAIPILPCDVGKRPSTIVNGWPLFNCSRFHFGRSLCPMCALVVEMPGLKSLDLSSNKVMASVPFSVLRYFPCGNVFVYHLKHDCRSNLEVCGATDRVYNATISVRLIGGGRRPKPYQLQGWAVFITVRLRRIILFRLLGSQEWVVSRRNRSEKSPQMGFQNIPFVSVHRADFHALLHQVGQVIALPASHERLCPSDNNQFDTMRSAPLR